MKSAVLFIVFNRPDTTLKVFEAIRAAKPPKLYVAADGPRLNRDGEKDLCNKVRQIATAVDWPCELKTLFSDVNLGCNLGPSQGISWLFENEEEGIILEDDVLPLSSFFPYCDELLERYRYVENVGVISGCNFISRYYLTSESYFFSRYNHIWGWASWRRAWLHFDGKMHLWPQWNKCLGLKTISDGNIFFELYWRNNFNKVFNKPTDIWDYQWLFSCWYYGMLTVLPKYNQTYNLGCGGNATHTTGTIPKFIKKATPENLIFPLTHPKNINRSIKADALIDKKILRLTLLYTLKRYLIYIPLVGRLLLKIKYIFNLT